MYKKNADIDAKKTYANLALRWCKVNMGINRRKKRTPKVSVLIRFKDDDDCFTEGTYWAEHNRIIIYDLNCNSIESVVATVIHEYTHYLQSMKKYWEFFEIHGYVNHPYEIEARDNEKKFTKICLREIKRLF